MIIGRRTILLVEDNDDDIELTRRAFGRGNLADELVVVRDGLEALDYLLATGVHVDRDPANLPHVVLLDLNLPKISGLEVLRRIRSNDIIRRLPVVVLTTSKEEKDIASSYDLGANSYVRKPVDFGQFIEAARQLGVYWLSLNERALTPGRTT